MQYLSSTGLLIETFDYLFVKLNSF